MLRIRGLDCPVESDATICRRTGSLPPLPYLMASCIKVTVDSLESIPHRAGRLALARISQCAVERRAFLVGANPTQQLSLQLVAARAVHGGNDMG